MGHGTYSPIPDPSKNWSVKWDKRILQVWLNLPTNTIICICKYVFRWYHIIWLLLVVTIPTYYYVNSLSLLFIAWNNLSTCFFKPKNMKIETGSADLSRIMGHQRLSKCWKCSLFCTSYSQHCCFGRMYWIQNTVAFSLWDAYWGFLEFYLFFIVQQQVFNKINKWKTFLIGLYSWILKCLSFF